jgi:hypothetical protein
LVLQAQQVGKPALIKKDSRPELWVTPVLIKTSVTDNWTVTKTDPVKLKEVIVSVLPTISNEQTGVDP